MIGLGEGDLNLRVDACNELELAGGEAACARVFFLAMHWEIVWLIQEAASDLARAEEFVEEFEQLILGEGECSWRLKLKADDGFESEKLEGMFEELSHKDGLLEDTKEVDDEMSWSYSLEQSRVCDGLK